MASDIAALKTALYDACLDLSDNPRTFFNQATIFDLGVIPNNDVNILLKVTQALVDEKLFKILQSEGLAWRLRSHEEARKYRSLKPEHEIVYGLIDEAGSEGIWSKTIKSRTNLHDAVFRSAIKALEGKNMITDMKSVEHPTRKMYIKSSLQPSDRATGGPWFTDGELDEEFIALISNVLYQYVQKRSWYEHRGHVHGAKKSPKKVHGKMSVEEIKAARERELGPATVEDVEDGPRRSLYSRLLPLPANYQGYPTLHELTSFIEDKGIAKDTTLSAEEIQQLLDLLVYDGKIERLVSGGDAFAYKAVRKTFLDEDDQLDSVLTEAPCGRCPVFDLCEEGGPVGPANCEYFNEWLKL
ncbi:putative DNA-directed RNA polymerase III subunit rpc6 [Hyphodiscus hymeniophilus]|uniref:DNA-directed RNA polymerase III subunit RPC6 n=1 Tax=Hyphodiscus hymeniophilus TaxID=353542 RepID=A0A9P7AZT2_9HELO|nr:putative DNA-directed RNA polymerase III subunit rpc6 [Hyphodiscus hymeniophilus]